jgi:Arc/MetJ family transcription regulator
MDRPGLRDLLAQVQALTGVQETSALVQVALTGLVERETARRLARPGGSEPGLAPIHRRRSGSVG